MVKMQDKGSTGHRALRYLDWAATAPLSTAAAEAMAEAALRLQSGEWANPSSVHGPGRAARAAREAARERLGAALGVPADSLIFTSGGTEALGLALGGSGPGPRLVGATEHAAVRAAAPDATVLPVDPHGRIRLDALAEAVAGRGEEQVVAVQQANNETGIVQDIAAIAEIVHAAGGRLLVDAVQSAGKLRLPASADFIAVSGHKMGGPAGIGALIVRCRERFRAVQPGGGQEQGYRGGTENLIGILGFAAAAEAHSRADWSAVRHLRERLEAGAVARGARVNGAGAERLPGISSLWLPGIAATTQLMALDLAGFAVSQGAACSSGTLKPSATLAAMGESGAASESIRVSLGPATEAAIVDEFLSVWEPLARRVSHAA